MNRLQRVLTAIVAELLEPTRYYAHVRYRVVKVTAGRLELQAVKKLRGYPDVLPVSMMCGMPGAKGEPTPGSFVLVVFIEGDPKLPVVTHFAAPNENAFLPVSTRLDATALVRIGEHAVLTELGSGRETVTNPAGRVVCWGDFVYIPSIGDVPLVPAGTVPATGAPPYPNITKVKA